MASAEGATAGAATAASEMGAAEAGSALTPRETPRTAEAAREMTRVGRMVMPSRLRPGSGNPVFWALYPPPRPRIPTVWPGQELGDVPKGPLRAGELASTSVSAWLEQRRMTVVLHLAKKEVATLLGIAPGRRLASFERDGLMRVRRWRSSTRTVSTWPHAALLPSVSSLRQGAVMSVSTVLTGPPSRMRRGRSPPATSMPPSRGYGRRTRQRYGRSSRRRCRVGPPGGELADDAERCF